MKSVYRLMALLLAVPALVFTACSEKEADYDATPAATGLQAYFSNTASTDIALADGQNSFTYTVYRVDASKDATVSVNKTTNDAIFTVPSSVAFKAGEKTATLTVTFDFNYFKQNADKAVSLGLALGDQTTLYGDSKVTLNVKYAPWTAWYQKYTDWVDAGYNRSDWPFSSTDTTAVYTYSLFFSGDDQQPIQFRQSLLDGTKCQFGITNWGYGITLVIDGTYNATTGVYDLQVPETFIGYTHSTYGNVMVSDMPHYKDGATYETYPCTYNPNTGTFSLYLIYYVSAGYFGKGEEVCLVDGVVRKDYSLSIAYAGGYINGKDAGAIVNFTKGADVNNYRYIICAGELSEKQVEALADSIDADEVAYQTSAESGPKTFSLAEDGVYTVVAVSYDSDYKKQMTVPYTFKYEYVGGAEEKWTPAYLGTFTYSVFFGSEEEPCEDVGLVMSVSQQNENRYKISSVFYGVDFIFEMDPETGALSYEDQFTGYTHPSYGDVYVGEVSKYSSKYADYVGYYKSNTFVFYNVYFVEAGSFGMGGETFKLTAYAEAKDYVTVPQKKNFTPVAWSFSNSIKRSSKPATTLNVKSKSISFDQMASIIKPRTL